MKSKIINHSTVPELSSRDSKRLAKTFSAPYVTDGIAVGFHSCVEFFESIGRRFVSRSSRVLLHGAYGGDYEKRVDEQEYGAFSPAYLIAAYEVP